MRCCGPWDRSPSSGAPPDPQHPSQAAAAAGGTDVSALINTLLASHLPLHLKRTFPCFISRAIFSQVHCTQYRPDQRKIKNNNPKTVRPLCATPLMLRSCIGQEDDPGWCMAARLQLQSLQEQKAMVSSLYLRSWESGPFPVVYASYSAVLLGAL